MCDDWDDNAPVVASSAHSQPWVNNPEVNDGWGISNPQNFDNYHGSNSRGYRSQTFTNSNRDGGGRSNRGNRQGFRGHENENFEEMNIPSNYVGRVIGRGGSKISELQTESACRIQVTKETDGETTLIKLFGDAASISKAKELITELTTDTIKFTEAKDQVPAREEPKKVTNFDWDTFLQDCDKAEAEQWAKYPPIKKEFYQEHTEVTRMTNAEVENFRAENNNIVVNRILEKEEKGKPIPKPCPTFVHAFHQYPEILEEIRKVGFEFPTPIQAQAWPVLLSGEDLIGIAQTGTGKTLAFLLPALIHIDGQHGIREERGGPAVLIMAPTRELALQIDKEVRKYEYRGIKSICIYGGGNRKEQVKVVTNGVDIVIATPGRLNDLCSAGHLDVKTVTYVVLDEADRMLDMGFEPQIRKVMYQIRPSRQTIMTSATWPMGVRRLAKSYMIEPVQIYVGSLDLAATHTVRQVIEIIPDDQKYETFMDFARNLAPDQKVIAFCISKAKADDLSSDLAIANIPCQTLHGGRDQGDREQALVDIADGTVQVLIATDVASRGLDIDDITHVVNYDFPRNIEEYVHRVGRTGRAGKYGESISYFTRNDWAHAKELIPILEEAQQFVPEELYQMAERYSQWKERMDKESGSRGRGGGRGGVGRFNRGRRW